MVAGVVGLLATIGRGVYLGGAPGAPLDLHVMLI